MTMTVWMSFYLIEISMISQILTGQLPNQVSSTLKKIPFEFQKVGIPKCILNGNRLVEKIMNSDKWRSILVPKLPLDGVYIFKIAKINFKIFKIEIDPTKKTRQNERTAALRS